MQNDYSDPRWQRLRLQVMDRDGWACVACGDTKSTLHVHHKRYCGSIWESPHEDLQTLCGSCHAGLGQHPKAGVWYQRVSEIKKGQCRCKTWSDDASVTQDTVVMAIQNCPCCGEHEFVCPENILTCWKCGWSIELRPHLFLHDPAALVDEQEQKMASEAKDAEMKARQAIGQLRSLAKRCRGLGFTDEDIWLAAFPEHAVPLGYQLDAGGLFSANDLADEEVQKLRPYLTSGMTFSDVVFEIASLSPSGRDALVRSGY